MAKRGLDLENQLKGLISPAGGRVGGQGGGGECHALARSLGERRTVHLIRDRAGLFMPDDMAPPR